MTIEIDINVLTLIRYKFAHTETNTHQTGGSPLLENHSFKIVARTEITA